MKIDRRSCERNVGIARSLVQTPFSGFFTKLHKLRSQLRGSVFISLTKEQTTETIDPSPKLIGLRRYPASEILS